MLRSRYSALSDTDPASDYPATDYHTMPTRLVALAWNMEAERRLSDEFNVCDLLYAEPPWPNGYTTFNERAAVDGSGFASLVDAISEVIVDDSRPVAILTGRAASRRYPVAETLIPVEQPGLGHFLLLGYRLDPDGLVTTSLDALLHSLAGRYEIVGDFCCGFGRTGQIFLSRGKGAVLSDVNPHCIGYIAEHAHEWLP